MNTSSLINNKFTNKHALLNRNNALLQSNGYDNYQKYIHDHDHFDKCTWWYTDKDDVTLQWEAAICISYEWMQIPFTTHLQVIDVSEWQEADEYQTHWKVHAKG